MNYQALFAGAGDKDGKVGLVGVGDFGTSLLARSPKIPNLEITVICDQDRARMEAAASAAGIDTAKVVMTDDIMGGSTPDFDVLVEATGQPEAAAIVRDFLGGLDPVYPPRLRAKILQSADMLFRAARVAAQ